MDRYQIEKLLKDVADHYKSDIGHHFAKATNRFISDLPADEQKRELLHALEHIVELQLDSVSKLTSGCRKPFAGE